MALAAEIGEADEPAGGIVQGKIWR